MRPVSGFGLVIALLLAPISAKASELQDAFKAAFGPAPQVVRHATLPHIGGVDLLLEPVLLVHVGGRRFALVVSESFGGGYADLGMVAVAYLDRDPTGWLPIKIWYEFDENGSFGQPFSRHNVFSFNFGETPFFAGEGELCGMGTCHRDYDLIGFNRDGPVDWGGIPASSSLEPNFFTIPDGKDSTGDVEIGCGGYDYSAVVTAPKNKDDVMRVTYTGWMIPGGPGQKRHDFRFSTDVYLANGTARLRFEVPLPNCGD